MILHKVFEGLELELKQKKAHLNSVINLQCILTKTKKLINKKINSWVTLITNNGFCLTGVSSSNNPESWPVSTSQNNHYRMTRYLQKVQETNKDNSPAESWLTLVQVGPTAPSHSPRYLIFCIK